VSDTGTTAVLVHGGTLTSTMWDDVRAFLRTSSYAVDLPGRRYKPADLSLVTREDWECSVCRDVEDAGLHDIVLVAHSSGGYVIPGVATRLSSDYRVTVRALLFVAATVPAEGKRPVDYLRDDLHALALGSRAAVMDNARGRTLGGLRPGEEAISTSLEIVENGPRMGLEAPGPLFEPFSWAGFPAQLHRTFVRGLRDSVIPPDLADIMVQNMGGASVVDLDAGHRSYATHPAQLAAVIDRIAA
jgi:pimeloyl-ACP methyl ester carboxylesterase